MSRIYGHLWLTNFGESDDGTWLEGLRGLTTANLGVGLRQTINSGGQFPPSLPEFRDLCLGISDDDVEEYAELLIKKSMGSFEYQRLTVDKHDRLIKKFTSSARQAIINKQIDQNIARLDNGKRKLQTS